MPFPGDRPEIINIGDSLTITFMDLPILIQPIEKQVASDGTITLINNENFTAAGKNRGELEKEIRARYVPRLYPRMTVTIKPLERFFFVSGEVRSPGAQRYISPITVLKAIPAAGDFTDFAQRKKIRLTRLNGKKLTINWYEAQKDPSLDPPVYPGGHRLYVTDEEDLARAYLAALTAVQVGHGRFEAIFIAGDESESEHNLSNLMLCRAERRGPAWSSAVFLYGSGARPTRISVSRNTASGMTICGWSSIAARVS